MMAHRSRRALLGALALSLLASVSAQAQNWPTRPVKVFMATAAGSGPDVIARLVTGKLSQMWGQQVLILNRPGAGGLIAQQALATAERDNHTLYLPSSSSLVVLPVTNHNLPLDIDRDLVPIGLIGESPFMIAASNSLGVNTLTELIARAKERPGELNYAGNFRGSLPNLTGEIFARHAGIKLTFVPYPGSAASMKDMLGERISLMIEGIAAFIGPLQANQVKALAVSSPARLPDRPDVPTVAETLPGFQSRGWTAVLAPSGTADDVVRKVNADLRTVLDIPEVRSRLESGATYVRHMTPAETRDYIRAERQAWRPVVKQFGVATQ
jgi:tripartite-type tricarboxylate transporter receptor subunit TctC